MNLTFNNIRFNIHEDSDSAINVHIYEVDILVPPRAPKDLVSDLNVAIASLMSAIGYDKTVSLYASHENEHYEAAIRKAFANYGFRSAQIDGENYPADMTFTPTQTLTAGKLILELQDALQAGEISIDTPVYVFFSHSDNTIFTGLDIFNRQIHINALDEKGNILED